MQRSMSMSKACGAFSTWSMPAPSGTDPGVMRIAFDIDMLRCIYCGLCEEVCPEEAIFLQNQYSMSGYSRSEMVNHKDRLYELGGTFPDRHFKWDVKKAAEARGGGHD